MKNKLESLILPLIIILMPFYLMRIDIEFLPISFLLPYAPLFASISIIYILKLIFENIKEITPKKKLTLFSMIIGLGLIFSCYMGYIIDLGNEYYIVALIFALLNILLVKYNYSLDDDFSFITLGLLIIFSELFAWAFLDVTTYLYVINPSLLAMGLVLVLIGIIYIQSYYEKTKVRLISGAILFSGVLLSYYVLKPGYYHNILLQLLINSIIPVGLFYWMWDNSKQWDKFNFKASSYLEKEKYEEALELLENDMGKYDDCYITWNNQGYALEKLGKYDDALISYEKALKMKPDSLSTLYAKATVLMNLERFEEAIEYFDRFLKNEPNELFIHVKKAESLNELKKSDEALEIIEEVLKKDPENGFAWVQKSYILKALDKPEEALENYDKALEIDTECEFIWFEKGLVLEKLERNNEALKSYEKALELDPEFEDAIDAKKDLELKIKS